MFDFQSEIHDSSSESEGENNFNDLYLSCSESEDEEVATSFDGYDSESDGYNDGDVEFDQFNFDISTPETDDENFTFTIGDTIAKALIVWAVKFGISHTAISELLLILKRFGHNELPKLARTLLRTPRKAVEPRRCGLGEFYYRGIQFNLLHYNQDFLKDMDTIELDFFIDGLSLSDSSKVKMWPIMSSFANFPHIRPFTVGCYSGNSDPVDVDDFMKEFVEEIKLLQRNGIEVSKDRIAKKFRFRCFIADAPARALASSTMGHSSYFGCPKCNQVCCAEGHKLYYQYFVGELRTDESFRKREDMYHHKPEFQHRSSLLEGIMGMVSQIVIEAMHAVDLGVTKRICSAIFGDNISCSKISKTALSALKARFKSFKAYVPSDFARKPRDLNELVGFKAAEFRQMLLYTLPVLLKNIVSPQLYKQVVKLHVAIRLLSDPVRYKDNIKAAKKLITDFVNEYDDTIGKKHFTFYTHCLLHITDYVEQYGPLYSLSAYKYENHMRLIKRLLRRKHGHIKQFFNRVDEMRYADEIADELQCNNYHGKSKFNEFILKANSLRDGCVMLESGYPLVITASFDLKGVQMCTMERLVVNKWAKPKCTENTLHLSNSKNKNITINSYTAPISVPHFRHPKNKSAILLQSKVPLNQSSTENCVQQESHKFTVPLLPSKKLTAKCQSSRKPGSVLSNKSLGAATHPNSEIRVLRKPLKIVSFNRASNSIACQMPIQKPSSNLKSNGTLQLNKTSSCLPSKLDKNQLVPLPNLWKSPKDRSNEKNYIRSSETQNKGVEIISIVKISEGNDKIEQNAASLAVNQLNFPIKFSSLMGKPWTEAIDSNFQYCMSVSNENKTAAILRLQSQLKAPPVKRSGDTEVSMVGKKVLLTKQMFGRLVPLPSNFQLSPMASNAQTNVDFNDGQASVIKSSNSPANIAGVGGAALYSCEDKISASSSDETILVPSTIPSVKPKAVRNDEIFDAETLVSAKDSSTSMIIPAGIRSAATPKIKRNLNNDGASPLLSSDANKDQFVTLAEFNKLKRKEAKNASTIKTIVQKLKQEDSMVTSFSFPLNDEVEYERFALCIANPRFTNKLVKTLERKTLRSGDVVSDLVETIFTPKLLNDFNVCGINKLNFKRTKINEIFFGLSKMAHEKYYFELTKVMHKMHMRHYRSEKQSQKS